MTSIQLSHETSLVIEKQEEMMSHKQESMCQFCNANFPSEEIEGHKDNCDMRKLNCDKCGERVLMDIFEIHYEECDTDQMDPSYEMYNRHPEDNNGGNSDHSGEMEEEEITQMNENEMTYERLLMLDENAVKVGMSPEQLKEFQEILYVKSLDGEGSCVICMSDYQTGEYLRKLSCRHMFHKKCIDQWLDAHITCPTCKKYLR